MRLADGDLIHIGSGHSALNSWRRDPRTLLYVARADDRSGPWLWTLDVVTRTRRRVSAGPAANPLWSPQGNLFIYAGRFVEGRVPMLAVRPDGTRVNLPEVRVREGGYRFLPDGTGLVYVPTMLSPNFWLLDLSSGAQRQLTRLDDRGRVNTFDVAPHGRAIVFERMRENSDIVLIDRPRPMR